MNISGYQNSGKDVQYYLHGLSKQGCAASPALYSAADIWMTSPHQALCSTACMAHLIPLALTLAVNF